MTSQVRESNSCTGTSFKLRNDNFVITRQQLNVLLASGDLTQQFIVDMAAKMIGERLLWCRTHQSDIRAESYGNLRSHLQTNSSAEDVGQAIRLPSSFVGSPRYMHKLQQDAYAILRR